MKVGDLVKKSKGAFDLGLTGIILEIVTNQVGNTIVTVSCEEGIRNWYSEVVEVINDELSLEQLEQVAGGMPQERYAAWRAEFLNESR